MWVCVLWKDCCSCLEVVSAPSLQKLRQRQNNCWSGILQRTWEKELNKVTVKLLPVLRARESKIIYPIIHSTEIILNMSSVSGTYLALGIWG